MTMNRMLLSPFELSRGDAAAKDELVCSDSLRTQSSRTAPGQFDNGTGKYKKKMTGRPEPNRNSPMGPKTNELVEILGQLVAMLESDGNAHWSDWMRRAQSLLERSDASGIDGLLSAYGGMGSFNDLILGQTMENGVFAWKPNAEELNSRFDELRSKAWILADALKRQIG
jgi:hypothetical protein